MDKKKKELSINWFEVIVIVLLFIIVFLAGSSFLLLDESVNGQSFHDIVTNLEHPF